MKLKHNRVMILYNDVTGVMDDVTFEYINDLRKQIYELEFSYHKLENELNAIKPIVTHEKYKPAISSDCRKCKNLVKSTWNHEVLGCIKDNVCDDFVSEEIENG